MMMIQAGRSSWLGRKCKSSGIAFATLMLALIHSNSFATQMERKNLAQLMSQSDDIVSGLVSEVTDGFDEHNVPFTEVTLTVDRHLKGNKQGKKFEGAQGESLTFRQFGLMKPRQLANGKNFLMTTPQGWSTYGKGENVMLFLHKPASMTGLQTTAGLSQGKFSYVNGQLVNSDGNKGLFEKLAISAANLTPEQQAMLSGTTANFNAKELTDLIERAVAENWVENGVMRNEK